MSESSHVWMNEQFRHALILINRPKSATDQTDEIAIHGLRFKIAVNGDFCVHIVAMGIAEIHDINIQIG